MLEVIESFDHISNSVYAGKGWGADISGVGIDVGRGRRGTNGHLATGARILGKNLPFGSKQERIVGFAWNPRDNFGYRDIATFRDSGSSQVGINLAHDDMLVKAYRNYPASPTLLAVGETVITVGQWYYVEMYVLIHGTNGVLELRIDGNVEFVFNGNTQATANATANELVFSLSGVGGGGSQWLDDIYVLDMVDSGIPGAPNNDFLGDVAVSALLPNGNGNASQLDGSDGNSTDNYLLVDDAWNAVDDDSTYVQSSDVGDKDTYAFSQILTSEAVVYGVQIVPRAKEVSAGTHTIVGVARSAGVEEDGPSLALDAYAHFLDVREADPSGNQWTLDSVDAAEFGVKVTAASAGAARVTQLAVEVLHSIIPPDTPTDPFSTEVLALNPWVYWKQGDEFSEAYDFSGNGRHGAYVGTPDMQEAGVLLGSADDGAVLYDAVNDYLRSPGVFNSPDCTMLVFYEYSGTPPGSTGFIAGCTDGDGAPTTDKVLQLTNAGKVQFTVFDGAGKTADDPSALAAGWHMLVGRCDGSTLDLWVDGVEVDSIAAGNTFTGYSVPNVFVAGSSGLGARLAGKRDEFVLWDSALTDQQIEDLWAASLEEPAAPGGGGGAAMVGGGGIAVSSGDVFVGRPPGIQVSGGS